MYLEAVFSRRVSSFLALSIVFLLALAVASWALYQADKLSELEKPLPLYIKIQQQNDNLN